MKKIPYLSDIGFTLVELLTVIAIISILATIALPAWVQYRSRAYDRAAHVDLKNAYSFTQAHFTENSGDTINLNDLKLSGFRQTPDVNIKILDGKMNTLRIEGRHEAGTAIYTIDAIGQIRPKPNN